MIHTNWHEKPTIKQVKCIHTNAEKYLVKNVLRAGNVYEVKNETEEFYFVVDNQKRVSGFYKDYFEDVK